MVVGVAVALVAVVVFAAFVCVAGIALVWAGLTACAATAVLGTVAAILLVGGILYSGYQRLSFGQTIGESIIGGATDTLGLTGLYAGMYNEDIATGQSLGLSNGEMGQQFGGGVVQFAASLFGARKLFGGPGCFEAGTQVSMAEEDPVLASVDAAVFAETSDWVPSAACVAAGVAGAAVAAHRNGQRKRKREYQDGVDAFFANDSESDWDPKPDDDPFSLSLDYEQNDESWLDDLDKTRLVAA